MKCVHRIEHKPIFEFHVSRSARERYQLDQSLFSSNGNVIFADFHLARMFAQKINEKRKLSARPQEMVRAGLVNAMGLIDEILHEVIAEYRRQVNPNAMHLALAWVNDHLGKEAVDRTLLEFIRQFPPTDVYQGALSAEDYLSGSSRQADGKPVMNREILLEELVMLWLSNTNPGYKPLLELFDDRQLAQDTDYRSMLTEINEFFKTQPRFGPDHETLIEMLQAPARKFPHSLADQLDFIRRRWGGLIPLIIIRLLSSLDMIREEDRPVFGVGGEPQFDVLDYHRLDFETEPERFSQDVFWMPNLVLLAKNTYVWLDQLSRKYKLRIQHLDEVPDDELQTISKWGFTGLWLIGLWERSKASQKIKQLRGNPDAVASAYSLYSYEIAADLGGESAYQRLREKAAKYNIRLASDMVPNHMGIDSRWVIEHPDWFLQLSYPPFPSYTFNGPNLSEDERVGIYIEDHYYDNSDAAVVFKRVDHWTGAARYIYHGNDGTSMPWNDTAQLNYLMPEVREAVIQTILHVARKFPIIRFDAAMTLAKRHYQRLWFPEPGSGGDIPSRAEFGLTKQQFNEAFPEEFWRMVVDRVAQEAPDTLLLAEAFWLMEGYFVRTLGMHRVYNSAFMNMLRDEKNLEYRQVIKNTMEFDPEILKRFVNFMNNPDERTAVDQFGKGDKYFGICMMLATLPGLPMFGHGQIEGFSEKYGMEFRYPKWHELPDPYLVDRHIREIFPLLRQRYLFAEAQNFRLYDFYTPEGYVNEDVFAYSNQAGDKHSLIVYHNRFADVKGWINLSAAYPVKGENGDEKKLVQTKLAENLGLHNQQGYYTIFREHVSGLEYISPSEMLASDGMYLELNAYQYLVFLDFREVMDDEAQRFSAINSWLNGSGVPDIQEALREYELRELLVPYRELINAGMFNWLIQNRVEASTYTPQNFQTAVAEVEQKSRAIINAIVKKLGIQESDALLAAEIREDIKSLLTVALIENELPKKIQPELKLAVRMLQAGLDGKQGLTGGNPSIWGPILCCLLTSKLGKIGGEDHFASRSRDWMDDWLFKKVVLESLERLQIEPPASDRSVDLIRVILSNASWLDFEQDPQTIAKNLLNSWLNDSAARRFLQIHLYEEVLWFNREAYETLVWHTYAIEIIQQRGQQKLTPAKLSKAIRFALQVVTALQNAEERSGYQVDKLM